MSPGRLLRDLPLFWKLLVPFCLLFLVVGLLGTVFLTRDLAVRNDASLDTSLGVLTVSVRAGVHQHELALLESADFAANVDGMAAAVHDHDRSEAAKLLESVLALKPELRAAAVLDPAGRPVAQLTRLSGSVQPVVWRPTGKVQPSQVVTVGDRTLLVVSGGVCVRSTCSGAGSVLVGIDVSALTGTAGKQSGTAVFDLSGRPLAASGLADLTRPPTTGAPDGLVRRRGRVGHSSTVTLYSPLTVHNRTLGTLAVTVPSGPALSASRAAALRLAGTLLAAMVGIVAIGAALSHHLLRQVRALLTTHHALAEGDLAARAPLFGGDELGELAAGVNRMAERLQSSHETLEQRVAQRTAEVNRLLEERSTFFAALSHDLRTPLAVIRGQASLQSDPGSRKSARWLAASAHTVDVAAEQMLGLVDNILDLAEAQSETLEVDLSAVHLSDVVDGLHSTIVGLATAAHLDVHVDLPADLPAVCADPARLRSVLLNLVDNAVKYTPAGGLVVVSAQQTPHGVAVLVSDTGIGIPAEQGERVFEPFHRVPGATPQGGQTSNGLGLAVARRLAEAQGGALSYCSTPGSGTTFTLGLACW
jgi:signal transduction histidine kinase